MNDTKRAYSGAPWEARVGYCRALRVGNQVWVTGTAAVEDDGSTHAPGEAYLQTVRCLEIIQQALAQVGARMEHVVRTRMFTTDISRWEEIGRAHGEFFADHPPTTTMVEVSALIDPEMVIEIEADALVRPPDREELPLQV
jgi:isochorismate pyruvate lyase